MSSNFAALTKSHKIIASKKRARREQVKEVTFDEDARRDFLTGFHKRKVQKKEEAKKKAQEREKQERLEARREQRRMLAERAAENAEQVEKAYRQAITGEDSADEDSGTVFTSGAEDKGHSLVDEEYEDEEHLATVTVVEDFEPETLIYGPGPSSPHVPHEQSQPPPRRIEPEKRKPKLTSKLATGTKRMHAKTATRAKDIKYQTKSERKTERNKQRGRKLEKAALAGGKASRKRSSGRSKR
ncbi:nucleolar protein 12-domain-containing protein [Cristinia sonorae]|uniref:Nucleolar protein 12-domain-containing protein n=1 Tax=Cristinia sonorae TaxID=1940300 RepID=A0A8K0UFT2_9AGAR|nr:nucleolar protein 12-domain-containing protein [Cristinia sonorae]